MCRGRGRLVDRCDPGARRGHDRHRTGLVVVQAGTTSVTTAFFVDVVPGKSTSSWKQTRVPLRKVKSAAV